MELDIPINDRKERNQRTNQLTDTQLDRKFKNMQTILRYRSDDKNSTVMMLSYLKNSSPRPKT